MEDFQQSAKQHILYLLKMRGAQTAATLAHELSISPMAVRQHLQSLKADQLVHYREERRPLGRPVKLWHLTASAEHLFPDSHGELLLDLLRSIDAVFGDDALARLVSDRCRRQMQLYESRFQAMAIGSNWRQRVEAIAHLRAQEGYMAEVVEHEDGLLLVENHCPICVAAEQCEGLCKAELHLFRALLGTTVTVERVEHILRGDRRCAYRVKPVA